MTNVRAVVMTFLLTASVPASELRVESGAVTFLAGTNVSAITVHGKSDRLEAAGTIRSEAERLVLERVTARLDPRTLSTGMGIRDQHMREKILQTPDGQMPELRFEMPGATCPLPGVKPAVCELNGTFFLRGSGQPFQMTVKLRPEGKAGSAWRVAGEGYLKLSAYGIEPPSQLGVKVQDSVAVKLELLVKTDEVRASK